MANWQKQQNAPQQQHNLDLKEVYSNRIHLVRMVHHFAVRSIFSSYQNINNCVLTCASVGKQNRKMGKTKNQSATSTRNTSLKIQFKQYYIGTLRALFVPLVVFLLATKTSVTMCKRVFYYTKKVCELTETMN